MLQLVVWTVAAERRPSAATGFAGLAAAVVSGFAVLPVTAGSGLAGHLLNAVTGLAERPVSAVASGWHCQRRGLAQCLAAVSVLQLAVWTGAASNSYGAFRFLVLSVY